MVYKKHHPTTQIDTAHTSLDKKCPSLKAILENTRKTQNTKQQPYVHRTTWRIYTRNRLTATK
jgi:hypothetical protein